jgi:hypothetical protein
MFMSIVVIERSNPVYKKKTKTKPEVILHSYRNNNVTIKDLKQTGMLIPIMSTFNIPVWYLQKSDGS